MLKSMQTRLGLGSKVWIMHEAKVNLLAKPHPCHYRYTRRCPITTYKAYCWIVLASFPGHVGGGSGQRTRLHAAMLELPVKRLVNLWYTVRRLPCMHCLTVDKLTVVPLEALGYMEHLKQLKQ